MTSTLLKRLAAGALALGAASLLAGGLALAQPAPQPGQSSRSPVSVPPASDAPHAAQAS